MSAPRYMSPDEVAKDPAMRVLLDELRASDFTFYCGTHRDQVKRGLFHGPHGGPARHYCPICSELMYWVPNAGTVVPPAETQGSRP